MPINNSNNDGWFNQTIFKAILALMLAGGTGWCAYINNRVAQIEDIKTDIAIIKTTLTQISEELHAQRHNP